MADKKITELTELSALDQSDLFVVVDDPAGTPVTKRITTTNLFGNVAYITTSTTGDKATLQASITSNAAPAAVANIAAAVFRTNATSTSTANVAHQYGIVVSHQFNGATANVSNTVAVGSFSLDVGAAAALPATNTFGLVVSVSNNATRTFQPTAFLKLADSLAATNTTSTKYLFSLNCAANVSATGNTTYLLSNCTGNTATNKLKIQINGTDYWLLVSNSAS